MRKILCGIAVGTLTLASPGIAAAQIGGGGGLVDLNVSDVGVSAPITPSGNQISLLGDNSQADSNNNQVASTAGRENLTHAGDTDDRDTTNTTTNTIDVQGDGNTVDTRNTSVGGQENTVVSGDGNEVAESRGDILVDGNNNTVVRDRHNSDDVSIVNRDGTVAFANRDGTVKIGSRVLPMQKAVKEGVIPAAVLTHKQMLFPRNFTPGARRVGAGGNLAKTGQDYGLLIMAGLAVLTAGYVVTRLTRQSVPAATTPGAPADITLVVPDPDAVEDAPSAEASPEREVRAVGTRQHPPVAPVVPAVDTALEDEIATLRRQLAELASAPSGLALAGV